MYVVSLGTAPVAERDFDFRDVVVNYDRYFHPAHGAKGFPRKPPNYLGFRYDGRLKRISFVEQAAIYDMRVDLPDELPDLPARHVVDLDEKTGRADHVVYRLGPAIVPARPVRTGNLYRAARVWAALDLLLTSDTIAEAAVLTRAREATT